MHALTIRLLGPLQIWRHGEPLPPDAWPTQKTRLLLLMLLTERGHSVPKERLMEQLWPELTPASAANSLRVNISHLRRLLDSTRDRAAESSYIHTHAEGYRFQGTPDCWIDVDAFWDAVARGQHEQAHGALNKALAAVEETDERWYEAEIIRLRGELLRASGAADEAETSFEQAIAIAQQQHTRAWELRATVSLCRLLQQQGRHAPTHERLAAIIGWFREGQDTPDLREAHALLAARSVP
jgi:DNA-binding SARP family transcriptional activator